MISLALELSKLDDKSHDSDAKVIVVNDPMEVPGRCELRDMKEDDYPMGPGSSSSTSSSLISPRPYSNSFSSTSSSSSSTISSAFFTSGPPLLCLPPPAVGSDGSSTPPTARQSHQILSETLAGELNQERKAKKHSRAGSSKGAADGELGPPVNFSEIIEGKLYRSGFPNENNFEFLKGLKLKSILTLVEEDYAVENRKFVEEQGLQFFQYGIPGNKSPVVNIPDERIVSALSTLLDSRNYPMLIHCNKGKHRTGCLVGCLRKMQQWDNSTTFAEYRLHSYPKSRTNDEDFIEAFNCQEVWKKIDPAQLLPELKLQRPASTLTKM